jgi:hypothetical protein
MSKPTIDFTFITYAPRTGEIGCLTKQSASLSGRGRRYVQPNQRLKLVVALVTHPSVTNVVVLEKFVECGRAQYLATFWAGEPPEIPFINVASRRTDAGRHIQSNPEIGVAPSRRDRYARAFNVC